MSALFRKIMHTNALNEGFTPPVPLPKGAPEKANYYKKTSRELNGILQASIALLEEYHQNAKRDELPLLYSLYNHTEVSVLHESTLPKDLVQRICKIANDYQFITGRLTNTLGEKKAQDFIQSIESRYFQYQSNLLSPKVADELLLITNEIMALQVSGSMGQIPLGEEFQEEMKRLRNEYDYLFLLFEQLQPEEAVMVLRDELERLQNIGVLI